MRQMTLQVESDNEAPRKSRSQLVDLRPHLQPRFDDVTLIVSELVSNSVRHSATSAVEVTVTADTEKVRIEVTDDGEGFLPEAPRGEGLGLALVAKIADSWGVVADGRFTVWVEIPKAAAD